MGGQSILPQEYFQRESSGWRNDRENSLKKGKNRARLRDGMDVEEEDSMDRVLKELREFTADHDWISENREDLLQKYKGQWIAVRKRRVIASDPDFDKLLSQLKDPPHTCVEFITNEPLEMIL
jgi:hypothetical protein